MNTASGISMQKSGLCEYAVYIQSGRANQGNFVCENVEPECGGVRIPKPRDIPTPFLRASVGSVSRVPNCGRVWRSKNPGLMLAFGLPDNHCAGARNSHV